MKILQVHKFYYPHRGAESYFFNLIELLEKHGHEVAPFAMADGKNRPSPYADYFTGKLDVSRPDYSLRSIKKIGKIIYNRQAKADASRLVQKFRPDIVHVHNIYHQLSPAVLEAFKEAGLPVVMTVHDFNLICPNYLLYTHGRICERCQGGRFYNCLLHRCIKDSFGASAVGAAAAYFNRLARIYEKNVDLYIAPSQFLKNKLVEFGFPPEKVVVLPHFVPAAKTPAKGAGKYILYAGALRGNKGVKELIRAFREVEFDADLQIAGDGPERVNLEKLVQKLGLTERVKFLGQLARPELTAVIRHSRLVVVPSLYHEVFGLAALEALAEGKPVLASSLGALPEVVTGEVGQIFNPAEKGSLGRSLNWLLSQPNLGAMGEKGWEAVKERYSSAEHYQRLLEIYKRFKI
ncbi:MAG: glycosyltransferase family 4 protein [Patescibacteria group bacterium]|jgi:glycosyltransferase involved in cell wall biosynthesis